MTRRAPLALCLLLAVLAGPVPGNAQEEGQSPELESWVYQIRFKTTKDVAILLQPLLGEHGAVTLQPGQRTVTVMDEPARVARIIEVIRAFDVAPRHVHLALQLIMGTQKADDEGFERHRPRQILPGIDITLIETLEQTRYNEYELLASASFTTAEGEESSLRLGEEYRIHLRLDSVNLEEGTTRFDRFALERGKESPAGKLEFLPIWDMKLNLRDNQLHVFGATRLEDSRRAIFLAVTAGIVP